MTVFFRRLAFALSLLVLFGSAIPGHQNAVAQNVAGVFGPEVTPGSRNIEFRVAAAPPSDGRPSRVTSRFHYQQAVTDNLRLRAIIQGADTNVSDFDFNLVQFEAQYQFLEDDRDGIDAAVRVDLTIAEDRPDVVSFNFTGEIPFGEKWYVRGVTLAQVQFGDLRNDGLFLQTRAAVGYKLNKRFQFQAQLFNFYGSTADFPDLSDQVHSIGPAVLTGLGRGWALETGLLLGLTDASSDVDFRVFLVKSF